RRSTVMEQFKQARRRPWRRDDFPEIVDWLEANEKPLELVVRGTQREMYFSPYPTMPLLIAVPLPGILESWSLAETLATRAMLHAGEGRFDAARQDLLACHRLGRLIGHGVTHIEFLTAAFIDEMAAQADVACIEISRPSAKQAIAYLDAINSLPTLPDAAKSMNWGERLGYLQLVSVFMQSPEEMLSEVHELSVFQVAVAKAML